MDQPNTERLQGIRLLLVDDSDLIVQLVSRQLRKWGVQLTVAENGVEAVRIATESNFDIILMDLHLPVLSGAEAAKQMWAIRPELPIIAMTGDDDTPAQFAFHIRKPVQNADLCAMILAALR